MLVPFAVSGRVSCTWARSSTHGDLACRGLAVSCWGSLPHGSLLGRRKAPVIGLAQTVWGGLSNVGLAQQTGGSHSIRARSHERESQHEGLAPNPGDRSGKTYGGSSRMTCAARPNAALTAVRSGPDIYRSLIRDWRSWHHARRGEEAKARKTNHRNSRHGATQANADSAFSSQNPMSISRYMALAVMRCWCACTWSPLRRYSLPRPRWQWATSGRISSSVARVRAWR